MKLVYPHEFDLPPGRKATAPSDVIICGDNIAAMDMLPDACIDLVVTSPPYDNLRTYSAGKSMAELWDFEGVAQQLWRIIKPGGVVVWVVADATVNGSETGTSFRQALRFMEIGFRLHDTMIYATDKPPMNDNRYQACFEFMFILSHGSPATFNGVMIKSRQSGGKVTGTYRQADGSLQDRFHVRRVAEEKVKESIWYIPGNGSNVGHPAPFPEALARDHILSWSSKGDTILDPFCGSGTTCKMAIETCRHFIGIEIHEPYCRDIIVPRITNADPGFGFNG